jgi:cyclopropane-fatty-acyl-phospholipid synthase
MIYIFKSQASAELIMLQPDAEQLLTLIGKARGAQGIIAVQEIPAAIAALQTAIAAHEEAQACHAENLPLDSGVAEGNVPLRHRAAPFMDLLTCSAKAGKDVLWGV